MDITKDTITIGALLLVLIFVTCTNNDELVKIKESVQVIEKHLLGE